MKTILVTQSEVSLKEGALHIVASQEGSNEQLLIMLPVEALESIQKAVSERAKPPKKGGH